MLACAVARVIPLAWQRTVDNRAHIVTPGQRRSESASVRISRDLHAESASQMQGCPEHPPGEVPLLRTSIVAAVFLEPLLDGRRPHLLLRWLFSLHVDLPRQAFPQGDPAFMQTLNPPATLVLSIDVRQQAPATGSASSGQRNVAQSLIWRICQERRIPATWCLETPDQASQPGTVPEHEFALLVGKDALAGRRHCRQTILRQMNRYHDQRIAVSTLAVEGQDAPSHLDVWSQAGLQFLRGSRRNVSTYRAWKQPRRLRFGMLELPPSANFEARLGWIAGSRIAWRLKHSIDRAIAEGGAFHLVVSDHLLNRTAADALRRVLDYGAFRRERGHLQIGTVSTAIQALRPQRSAQPARSILRLHAA